MSRSVEKPYRYSWLANALTSSETPVTPAAPRLESRRQPGKATQHDDVRRPRHHLAAWRRPTRIGPQTDSLVPPLTILRTPGCRNDAHRYLLARQSPSPARAGPANLAQQLFIQVLSCNTSGNRVRSLAFRSWTVLVQSHGQPVIGPASDPHRRETTAGKRPPTTWPRC